MGGKSTELTGKVNLKGSSHLSPLTADTHPRSMRINSDDTSHWDSVSGRGYDLSSIADIGNKRVTARDTHRHQSARRMRERLHFLSANPVVGRSAVAPGTYFRLISAAAPGDNKSLRKGSCRRRRRRRCPRR